MRIDQIYSFLCQKFPKLRDLYSTTKIKQHLSMFKEVTYPFNALIIEEGMLQN